MRRPRYVGFGLDLPLPTHMGWPQIGGVFLLVRREAGRPLRQHVVLGERACMLILRANRSRLLSLIWPLDQPAEVASSMQCQAFPIISSKGIWTSTGWSTLV